MSPTRRVAALLVLTLLLSACGGDGEETAEDTTEEATQEATQEAATEEEPTGDASPAVPPTLEATEAPPAPEAPTLPPAATTEPAPAPPLSPPAPAATEAMSDLNDDMGVGGASSYDSYTTITDDTGAIVVQVPTEWSDVDGRPYTDEQGRQLYDVRASSDLQAFSDTWNVPGVVVTASTEVAQTENEVTLLDERVSALSTQCTYIGRQPYSDALYAGQVDVYESCGGTDTGYVVLGAVPESRAFVIRVEVQVVEERDIEALFQALATFVISGDV